MGEMSNCTDMELTMAGMKSATMRLMRSYCLSMSARTVSLASGSDVVRAMMSSDSQMPSMER